MDCYNLTNIKLVSNNLAPPDATSYLIILDASAVHSLTYE